MKKVIIDMSQDKEAITPEQLVAKYQNPQHPSDVEALEGIDKIDWSSMQHAYGDATDFPALMRASLSRNEQDREFALKLLFATIWHQGTVYEASPYAVPFLLKALESPETPDKTAIALLLSCLADGHSYLDVHALSDEKDEKIWMEILAEKNLELETELIKEIEHVNATRKAVEKGLHLLYPYLQDENASYCVAKVLVFFPEHKAEIIPWLERAQALINDKDAKKEIQLALAKLREAKES